MIDAAGAIGLISACLLAAAVFAWILLLKGPELYKLEGPARSRPIRLASRLILISLAVGGVAAILAVAGFIAG